MHKAVSELGVEAKCSSHSGDTKEEIKRLCEDFTNAHNACMESLLTRGRSEYLQRTTVNHAWLDFDDWRGRLYEEFLEAKSKLVASGAL